MDTENLKKQLVEEGFLHVYEWTDKPHTLYEAHSHRDAVAFYVVEGEIIFMLDGKEIVLRSGSRFDVPPGALHTARVGSSGCSFVVGEMIEGDS